MKLFRKHSCPPDAQIRVFINGQLVIGPIMGEELAYIAKYGHGTTEPVDLMETCIQGGKIEKIEFLVQYYPRVKR